MTISTIEQLDLLDPIRKLQQLSKFNWSRGLRLAQSVDGKPYDVIPDDIHIDKSTGAILHSRSHIIGRPCFGIIVDFLREMDRRKYWHKESERMRDTRCGLCPLYDACEKVCRTRMKVLPEVQSNFEQLMIAGGPQALRDRK